MHEGASLELLNDIGCRRGDVELHGGVIPREVRNLDADHALLVVPLCNTNKTPLSYKEGEEKQTMTLSLSPRD